MKKIFHIVLIALIIKNVTGQESNLHSASIISSFSIGNAQYKEYLLNGLRNSGLNLSLGGSYLMNRGTLAHEWNITADASLLWNRYGWVNWYAKPNLHYRLMVKVNKTLSLGGLIGYSTMYYENENLDSQHNFWISTINLSFSAYYNVATGSFWKLYVPFSFPLTGFLSRPAANRNLILNEPDLRFSDVFRRMNSNFSFVTIGNRYFEFETGILLQLKMVSGQLAYILHYQHTSVSKRTELLVNKFYINYPITVRR